MAPRPPSLLLFALTLLLAACAPAPGTSQGPIASPSPSATATPQPATSYPLTLTDDAGREVTIAADPQRIVSLAPSNTEIVCALEACDQVVGVTDFDDYPPQVVDIEKVVVFAQVDVEKVVAAEPDLVLAAGNEFTATAVIDQLTELGLAVVVLYPESLDEVYADIELVGAALDAQAGAAELVDSMQARVEAVETAVADAERPRTYYEVSIFEGTIYTAGEGSFLASLIDIAGGEPITGDPLATSIQLEELVAADPELILLGDAAYDATVTPESVSARMGWSEMAAVRDGRVLPMPDDLLITRPGPRIVDGLEALARAIHPDLAD
ncbi:MAG TPA: ABC transporter substrate-binding protein [Candidatus Dormibacteraeota bacterium]|nr:ABC transporter substrate-binding protein [Candidatus Dormibacteraeota bacterium]